MTRVSVSVTIAAVALACATQPAAALEPKTRTTQYRHTAWRVQDGAFESAPNAVTQTADGYILIGTNSGLVRFDGVRFQAWNPPGKSLSSTAVLSLLSASDGTLWIGTATGLLSWTDERLQEHLGGRIAAILEDHTRRIWVARSLAEPTGALCQVVGDHPGCTRGNDRTPLLTAAALSEDPDGNLWVGASNQLTRWRDGAFSTYLRELEGYTISSVSSIAAATDGSVWTAIPRKGFGLFRIVNDVPRKTALQDIDTTHIRALFIDRDRSLWMGTSDDGIYRVVGERVDRFRTEHGLSSNAVNGFFEDREGNLWVATSKGLDCFRESPVVAFSPAEGISPGLIGAMLASQDGTVWLGRSENLEALRGDRVTVIRIPGDRTVNALWQDHAGRLWVGLENMLTVYEHGQFRPIYRPDGSPLGTPIAIAEDREENVWVSVGITTSSDRKLFRIRDLSVKEEYGPDRIPLVRRVSADPTGGIWLAFENGSLGHYQSGNLEIVPLPSTGAEVRFPGLTIDSDGSAWVSTWSGLVRVKGRETKTLTSKNGLPCDAVVSTVRDNDATLWLYTKCGFVAVADSELEQWWQRPDRIVQTRVLDVLDGAVLPQGPKRLQPVASRSPDGRLWFVNDSVLQAIDPGGLRKNRIPPPVYVEDMRADGKDYGVGGLVRLPWGSRDIEIGYTGLSFSVPQKVRFRYRLEARDQQWQDAGTRRRVFYNNLPPGRYRFHVRASNNDGVWNDAAATVSFMIPPAYYQTTWFFTFSMVAVSALVWTAHRIRLRMVEAHHQEISALNERLMKAQEQERIRIAGELHDSVMQEMLAVTMMLGSAKRRIADDSEAHRKLDTIQDKMIGLGAEIRRLSHDLHPPILQETGLPQAVRAYCEQFSASSGVPIVCEASERTRDLSPGAALALFRIMQEALGNAAKHARATRITVQLTRTNGVVSLLVADDGVGFDAVRPGPSGGLGLIMMRERAAQLGGTFAFNSAPGDGTSIRVNIPFR